MICPSCQRQIDALRAPVARIAGGKVITYCSAECARGEPKKVEPPAPASVAVAPAAAAPAVLTANSPPVTDGAVVAEVRQVASSPATAARVERSAPVMLPAPPERRSRKRVVFAALGMLVAAGIGGAIVQSVSPGNPTPAAASEPAPPPAPAPAPVVPAAPPAPSRADVALAATRLLEGFLADASPRMRREAAMALARIKHPGALEELVKQLEAEPSVIAQVAVAEALARAGHARGRAFLHAAVGHARRDVRMSAAIALAGMGDAKGRGPLVSALSSRILRLSAAASLALLGEAQGVKALEEALASNEPEPRMRAAAALGKAGNPAGATVLREMIADPRYEQLAATALARLGDKQVVPVLTRALGLTALAVEAAEALRRLGVEVDPSLVAAQLGAGDEIARIEAAEAALVLFGDVPLEPLPLPAAPTAPGEQQPPAAPSEKKTRAPEPEEKKTPAAEPAAAPEAPAPEPEPAAGSPADPGPAPPEIP